jgi:hypothetical protein
MAAHEGTYEAIAEALRTFAARDDGWAQAA